MSQDAVRLGAKMAALAALKERERQPDPRVVLDFHAAGWAALTQAIVDATQEADTLMAAITIHRGPALLADLFPKVCEILRELTGTPWNYRHVETRPVGQLWAPDGPVFSLSVDHMLTPRYAYVHTIWTPTGATAWSNACFAAVLRERDDEDPFAKVALARGADRIAREIAANVLPRAEALWEGVSSGLTKEETRRERHDAMIKAVADSIGKPHIQAENNGAVHFSSAGKGYRWGVAVNHFGEIDLTVTSASFDLIKPTLESLPRQPRHEAVTEEKILLAAE